MIFSVHQPCYFPWLGLLHKIASSSTLIVLDEVQLSDSAFQNRNQFMTNDGQVKYLTIPIEKKNYLQKPFKDLLIADEDWGKKHINFLRNNYGKHPFFKEVFPTIESALLTKSVYLIDAVMHSLETSMTLFRIDTKIVMQSDVAYNREAKKGDLVLQLLLAEGASHYLSGRGAQAYQDDDAFVEAGIRLEYSEFHHPIYPQKNASAFIPGLSCLDMAFNIGTENAASHLIASAKT